MLVNLQLATPAQILFTTLAVITFYALPLKHKVLSEL
jgi:hypothetical protein